MYLEQYEPREDGRKLEFVREVVLADKDGKPFSMGSLAEATEFILEISFATNG